MLCHVCVLYGMYVLCLCGCCVCVYVVCFLCKCCVMSMLCVCCLCVCCVLCCIVYGICVVVCVYVHHGSHMGPVYPPYCLQPFNPLLDPPSTLSHGQQKLLAEGRTTGV